MHTGLIEMERSPYVAACDLHSSWDLFGLADWGEADFPALDGDKRGLTALQMGSSVPPTGEPAGYFLTLVHLL